jgi:esterase/lipase
MNAFIPRLAEHGLVTEDALLNNTPDVMWESAKQSLVLAKALGNKIILMGCSTGGTLALKLAAEYPDDIAGLFLYSPNVSLYNKAAAILTLPWGLQIGRLIVGGDYRYTESDPETDPYWYTKQRAEGAVYLQQLVKTTMTEELFADVSVPAFVGYYYKDEEHQDNTVSVEAIKWMYEELGTPDEMKREIAFPEAGSHVMCCHLTSGSWKEVQAESIKFAQEKLNLSLKY